MIFEVDHEAVGGAHKAIDVDHEAIVDAQEDVCRGLTKTNMIIDSLNLRIN